MLDVELKPARHILRPPDHARGEKRFTEAGASYLWSCQDGQATWDCIQSGSMQELRLTVQPDEGSAMFCAVEFLQKKHCRVLFCRDELHRGYATILPHQRLLSPLVPLLHPRLPRHKLQNHVLKVMGCP